MLSRGDRPADAGGVHVGREWWLLAVIVAIGAYLRLAHLGALGFRWDEDLSGLAVRAILEKGIPELPSGMIYLRGGLFRGVKFRDCSRVSACTDTLVPTFSQRLVAIR